MTIAPWFKTPNNHARRGNTLFKAHYDGGASAWDATTGRVLWERPGAGLPDPPRKHSRGPGQPIWIWPDSRRVWADERGTRIVTLAPDGKDLRLVGRDADGRLLWMRGVPLPPSARMPDSPDTNHGFPAEFCRGFLADVAERPVLVLAFEKAPEGVPVGIMRWPTDPEYFEARLEMRGLDPDTGADVWTREVADVSIPTLEHEVFAGHLITGRRVVSIDAGSGAQRELLHAPESGICWPAVLGPHVLLAHFRRGTLTIEAVDRTTLARVATSTLKCPKPRDVTIYTTPSRALVQINDSDYALLGPALEPLQRVKLRGYCDGLREVGGDVEINCRYQTAVLDGRTGAAKTVTPHVKVKDRRGTTRWKHPDAR